MPKITSVCGPEEIPERFTETEQKRIQHAINNSQAMYYICDDDGAPRWAILDLKHGKDTDIRRLAELVRAISPAVDMLG